MNDIPPQDAESAELPPPDDAGARAKESIGESFSRLIASGKEFAQAELNWAKLKAILIAGALRRAAMFGVVALVLVVLALIVLVAAAVIALAPAVGWLGATLIVAAVLLLLAAMCGLIAKRALNPLTETNVP